MEDQLKEKAAEEKAKKSAAKRGQDGDEYIHEEPSNKRSKPSDFDGLHDRNYYTLHPCIKQGYYSEVWGTFSYFDREDHPRLKSLVKCNKCDIELHTYSSSTVPTKAMKRHARSCSNVHRKEGYDFEAATLAAQNEDGMVAPHRSFYAEKWNHYFFSEAEVGDGTNIELFRSAKQVRCRYCEKTFLMNTMHRHFCRGGEKASTS